MTRLFHRLLKAKFYAIALLAVVSAPFALGQMGQGSSVRISSEASDASLPKTAVTGAWTWTDVSDQIPYRTNRPIWNVAKMESGWIFTDGLPFDEGGFVVATDGTTVQADLTEALREAGLTRVDDIVEDSVDSESLLFAEGVSSRTDNYRLVQMSSSSSESETGIALNDLTDTLKDALGTQGIARIVGTGRKSLDIVSANGFYYIYEPQLTDKPVLTLQEEIPTVVGIVALYNSLFGQEISDEAFAAMNQATTLAQRLESQTPYEDQLAYSKRKTSPADQAEYLPVASSQVGNDWALAAIRGAYASSTEQTSFFFLDAKRYFEDVTDQVGTITKLHAMAGGGDSILIAGTDGDVETTNKVLLYDGETVTDLSEKAAALPFDTWNRAQIAWNGVSWLILSGKNLVRFDGENFEDLGRTRDLFLSVTGADGKFVLGGVVSQKDIDEPLFPLQAKLVIIEEDVDEPQESMESELPEEPIVPDPPEELMESELPGESMEP